MGGAEPSSENKRRAAIKILPPDCIQSQQKIQQVFNDAWAVSLLQHPGVVTIYDTGLLADGSAYIAMDRV